MGDQPKQENKNENKPANKPAEKPEKTNPEDGLKKRNPDAQIKNIEIEGYKFQVDTDLLDDVEAFEYVNAIENENKMSAIVPLLKYLVGDTGYEKMKAHFVKKHGKFRITKLAKVYQSIVDQFDPKD